MTDAKAKKRQVYLTRTDVQLQHLGTLCSKDKVVLEVLTITLSMKSNGRIADSAQSYLPTASVSCGCH